jgi:hypothetical protein
MAYSLAHSNIYRNSLLIRCVTDNKTQLIPIFINGQSLLLLKYLSVVMEIMKSLYLLSYFIVITD